MITLHWEAYSGRTVTVSLLIEKGVEINAKENLGMTFFG
jgi:ankyrin repeat protein